MITTYTRNLHSRANAPDTWGEFARVLFVSLAILAMALPADDDALVGSNVGEGAGVSRPRYVSVLDAIRRVSQVAADPGELEGCPGDNDFRPSPDRTHGAAHRSAPPSPLAVRCPGTPHLSFDVALLPHATASPRAAPHVAPAVDTSVQILC